MAEHAEPRRTGYPIDPYWAMRAANLRDAEMFGILCKTCKHFRGLEGVCGYFTIKVSMSEVCDEWSKR